MSFDPLMLALSAVFATVILFVIGMEAVLNKGGAGRDKANRRMRMVHEGTTTQDIISQLRREMRQKSPFLGPIGHAYSHLDYLITQAGLMVPTNRVVMIMGGAVGAAFIAITLLLSKTGLDLSLGVSLGVSVGGAALVGIGLPYFVINRMKAKRHKKFVEQLPDALDIMVRSLRAGHPVFSALNLVTEEMADPVGTEFGLAVDEMTYGLDLREALENLSKRVDVEEFRYVVVAIGIQNETGGNLAEVLQGLSTVIRDRFRLRMKVKALSGEGRASAWVLCVLPFAVGTFIMVFNPDYYLGVKDDPMLAKGLGMVGGLMLLGIFTMYRMVNFKV